jgi:hypothetical protein
VCHTMHLAEKPMVSCEALLDLQALVKFHAVSDDDSVLPVASPLSMAKGDTNAKDTPSSLPSVCADSATLSTSAHVADAPRRGPAGYDPAARPLSPPRPGGPHRPATRQGGGEQ